MILAFCVVITMSCTKEDVNVSMDELINPIANTENLGSLVNQIQVEMGKLKFTNVEHFQAVLNYLENRVDSYNDSFSLANWHLTDQQFNEYADLHSFDEYYPLVDFENSLGFYSRRKFIEDKIDVWLNNPTLNLNNIPHRLDNLDKITRTLLDQNGTVIIGNQIINFLSGIENNKCYRNRAGVTTGYYANNNKLFILQAKASSSPLVVTVSSEVDNYKKVGNRWVRESTMIFMQVSGFVRDDMCNSPLPTGVTNGPSRRRSLSATRRTWFPPVWARFKDNEVVGFTTVTNEQLAGMIRL